MSKKQRRAASEETSTTTAEAAPVAAATADAMPADAMPAAPMTVDGTEAAPIDAAPIEDVNVADAMADARPPEPVVAGRDRIQQQLEALKQREAELRRELAIADHPELADAIRSIEGRAYAVTRVEARMAEGLSKAEQRRKETLEKKLATLHERRAELDAQIASVAQELEPLGDARARAFEKERAEALAVLVTLMRTHASSLTAAGLEIESLVPALASWRQDLAAMGA